MKFMVIWTPMAEQELAETRFATGKAGVTRGAYVGWDFEWALTVVLLGFDGSLITSIRSA